MIVYVRKHYSPGFAELVIGGRMTGRKDLLVVFDSGSSYTYLNSQTYQTLLSFVSLEVLSYLLFQVSSTFLYYHIVLQIRISNDTLSQLIQLLTLICKFCESVY